MGKSTQPLLKRCKSLGINPVVMGYTKETKRHQKDVRKKKSEYGVHLAEKPPPRRRAGGDCRRNALYMV